MVYPALLQRAEYLGLAPWHADLKYVSNPWTDQGLDEFSIARVVGVHLYSDVVPRRVLNHSSHLLPLRLEREHPGAGLRRDPTVV